MPRIARKDMETEFFHLVVQGIDREYIFNESKYKERYKKALQKYSAENNIAIIAYCIMDNHAHILIHCDKIKDMSKFMHCVNTSYSYYYNEVRDRVGIVFRNRYLSEPVFNEKYLYNCIKYIHNNPVKANIVKNALEYKYSSHNEYFFNNTDLLTNNGIGFDYIKAYKANISTVSETESKFLDYIGNNINVKEAIEKYCKDRDVLNIVKDKDKLADMLRCLVDMKITKVDIAKELNISRGKITGLLKRSVPNVQK